MALKSPENVQDVGKQTAPPAVVAAAAKDLPSTQGGQPEIVQDIPSKAPGEQASGNPPHERRHSLGDDPAAMTIEFLRARLLSERSASKSARQRIQLLSKRVMELEQKLEFEIGQRNKAEAAIREALSMLTQAGLIVDSSAFFTFSTEVATVELGGKDVQTQNGKQSANGNTVAVCSGQGHALQGGNGDEGSGKRGFSGDEDPLKHNTGKDSNGVANGNIGDEESTSSEDGTQLAGGVAEFQAQQKPIAWKGKKGDPESQGQGSPQAEPKKSPELLKSAWVVDPTPDAIDSPKRRNGRSLRRIQRRETRVVEERLKGMWDRLGEEIGTLSEGRAEEDLERSELMGWMGDVVNMLQNKPEENPILSDGSGDSKVDRGKQVDTAVHEGGPSSNGATAKETKDGQDSFLDSSNKSFEKLIAEYEAEEKAQRLWEKQYHAKQHSADSSSLNQDVQAGTLASSGPPDPTATVSNLGGELSPESGQSAVPHESTVEKRAEEFCVTDSSLAPVDLVDPDLSIQGDVVGFKGDISNATTPLESDEVLIETVESATLLCGSQVGTEALPLQLDDNMTADSVTEVVASELMSSSADHSADTPGELQAPLAEAARNEGQAPVVEAVRSETQAPLAGAARSEVQLLATKGADLVAISDIYEDRSGASQSIFNSEAIGDPLVDRQDHVPSLVQDGSSLGPKCAEQQDIYNAPLPATSELGSDMKLGQDSMPEQSTAHEAANGAYRRPYRGTSLDYRDHWLESGPPPLPPDPDRRDMRAEWLRHRRAAEYARHGDFLHASRSQVGYEDGMIEDELAYRRMESEYYAQERRRMIAHYRRRSPPLPGADYERELYEQPGFQRSRSITNRQLYRSLDADSLFEPEISQRSRSAGRGYPNERGYRMYDIDDRFPYHERVNGYHGLDHAYGTSVADAELDYERAFLRQGQAVQEPMTREEQYRTMQQYPADFSSFDREVEAREFEPRASPRYPPADQVSPQQTSPTFGADAYADVNVGAREASSSGLQVKHGSSPSIERTTKREALRTRKDPVMKSSQAEPATQSTPHPLVTQRKVPERTRGQPPPKNVQPERGSRGPPRAPAPGPQRKETTDRPLRASASKKLSSDRKGSVAAKVAPVEQSQTYLALPSYAGEGEENVETGMSQGEKLRPASDKQQSGSERTGTPKDYSGAAREGQRQSQSAKEGRDTNAPGARAAREGPEDSNPILALPSYAGEGVGADANDAYNLGWQQEIPPDVSISAASQVKAVHQPATDAAYYRPSNDVQLQAHDRLQLPRFSADDSSPKLRGSSAHSRGAQVQIHANGGQEYRRGGRFDAGRHVPVPSSLPSYTAEGASIYEREALRLRGAELYNEAVRFEGRNARDRLPPGLDTAATQYAHLREIQQPYQGFHGAQVMRDDLPARHHALPPAGSRGTSANLHLNPKEPSPSLSYAPAEDQASGANLGDILKALQLAKDRIQSSAGSSSETYGQFNPQEQGCQAMLPPPPSRLYATPDAVDRREDMFRAPVHDLTRAEVMGHYASGAKGPFVRLPQSSSVSSAGMDSPAGLVLRDGGNSVEGFPGTYVDRLNVGKGIQFFFP